MKIGIMGGTFDPVHLAHLEMGRAAKRQKNLDEVWFMPTKIPPHKKGKVVTDENIRFKMVEIAVSEEKDFYASDFELQFPQVTYTAQTVERLQMTYPEHTFYFILGGDSLFYFDQWFHPEKILHYTEVLAFSRDGIPKKAMEERAAWLMQKLGGVIEILEMKHMEISSSMIRRRIAEGKDVKKYLPKGVHAYLAENGYL